ncbi:hypothetical protein [Endozoicomonas sp. 8E]|uniref:hypothetical protein n=1 Tax=Endozoicomonas sp. 8E TaxID=3035692 RepID=UPI00293944DF|nr:hypothetical protein [Endozoicomonas sp. 8E]WOG29622.1 hypothetical protein P6910_08200 [Endozoicomonas sp. 8E]
MTNARPNALHLAVAVAIGSSIFGTQALADRRLQTKSVDILGSGHVEFIHSEVMVQPTLGDDQQPIPKSFTTTYPDQTEVRAGYDVPSKGFTDVLAGIEGGVASVDLFETDENDVAQKYTRVLKVGDEGVFKFTHNLAEKHLVIEVRKGMTDQNSIEAVRAQSGDIQPIDPTTKIAGPEQLAAALKGAHVRAGNLGASDDYVALATIRVKKVEVLGRTFMRQIVSGDQLPELQRLGQSLFVNDEALLAAATSAYAQVHVLGEKLQQRVLNKLLSYHRPVGYVVHAEDDTQAYTVPAGYPKLEVDQASGEIIVFRGQKQNPTDIAFVESQLVIWEEYKVKELTAEVKKDKVRNYQYVIRSRQMALLEELAAKLAEKYNAKLNEDSLSELTYYESFQQALNSAIADETDEFEFTTGHIRIASLVITPIWMQFQLIKNFSFKPVIKNLLINHNFVHNIQSFISSVNKAMKIFADGEGKKFSSFSSKVEGDISQQMLEMASTMEVLRAGEAELAGQLAGTAKTLGHSIKAMAAASGEEELEPERLSEKFKAELKELRQTFEVVKNTVYELREDTKRIPELEKKADDAAAKATKVRNAQMAAGLGIDDWDDTRPAEEQARLIIDKINAIKQRITVTRKPDEEAAKAKPAVIGGKRDITSVNEDDLGILQSIKQHLQQKRELTDRIIQNNLAYIDCQQGVLPEELTDRIILNNMAYIEDQLGLIPVDDRDLEVRCQTIQQHIREQDAQIEKELAEQNNWIRNLQEEVERIPILKKKVLEATAAARRDYNIQIAAELGIDNWDDTQPPEKQARLISQKIHEIKQPVITITPTTVAATSITPTRVSATSIAPTSIAPTSIAPTSIAPTSIAPTSIAPTSIAPTSIAPTSIALTSIASTSIAPTLTASASVAATGQPREEALKEKLAAIESKHGIIPDNESDLDARYRSLQQHLERLKAEQADRVQTAENHLADIEGQLGLIPDNEKDPEIRCQAIKQHLNEQVAQITEQQRHLQQQNTRTNAKKEAETGLASANHNLDAIRREQVLPLPSANAEGSVTDEDEKTPNQARKRIQTRLGLPAGDAPPPEEPLDNVEIGQALEKLEAVINAMDTWVENGNDLSSFSTALKAYVDAYGRDKTNEVEYELTLAWEKYTLVTKLLVEHDRKSTELTKAVVEENIAQNNLDLRKKEIPDSGEIDEKTKTFHEHEISRLNLDLKDKKAAVTATDPTGMKEPLADTKEYALAVIANYVLDDIAFGNGRRTAAFLANVQDTLTPYANAAGLSESELIKAIHDTLMQAHAATVEQQLNEYWVRPSAFLVQAVTWYFSSYKPLLVTHSASQAAKLSLSNMAFLYLLDLTNRGDYAHRMLTPFQHWLEHYGVDLDRTGQYTYHSGIEKISEVGGLAMPLGKAASSVILLKTGSMLFARQYNANPQMYRSMSRLVPEIVKSMGSRQGVQVPLLHRVTPQKVKTLASATAGLVLGPVATFGTYAHGLLSGFTYAQTFGFALASSLTFDFFMNDNKMLTQWLGGPLGRSLDRINRWLGVGETQDEYFKRTAIATPQGFSETDEAYAIRVKASDMMHGWTRHENYLQFRERRDRTMKMSENDWEKYFKENVPKWSFSHAESIPYSYTLGAFYKWQESSDQKIHGHEKRNVPQSSFLPAASADSLK